MISDLLTPCQPMFAAAAQRLGSSGVRVTVARSWALAYEAVRKRAAKTLAARRKLVVIVPPALLRCRTGGKGLIADDELFARVLRNLQHLPRLDLVRVAQLVAVGVEDVHVVVGVAEKALRNRAQGVALFHGVGRRFGALR